MDRDTAHLIVETCERHVSELNTLLFDIQNLCTEEEFSWLKRSIGQIMGELHVDVMAHIFVNFPDLKPDYLA